MPIFRAIPSSCSNYKGWISNMIAFTRMPATKIVSYQLHNSRRVINFKYGSLVFANVMHTKEVILDHKIDNRTRILFQEAVQSKFHIHLVAIQD